MAPGQVVAVVGPVGEFVGQLALEVDRGEIRLLRLVVFAEPVADQPDPEPGVGNARAALGAVPLGAGELLVQGQHSAAELPVLAVTRAWRARAADRLVGQLVQRLPRLPACFLLEVALGHRLPLGDRCPHRLPDADRRAPEQKQHERRRNASAARCRRANFRSR